MKFSSRAPSARLYEHQEGWNQMAPALASAELTIWPWAGGELAMLWSSWHRHVKGWCGPGEWEGGIEPSAHLAVPATHRGETEPKPHPTQPLAAVFPGRWKHNLGFASKAVTQPHHCATRGGHSAINNTTTKKPEKMCHLLCVGHSKPLFRTYL